MCWHAYLYEVRFEPNDNVCIIHTLIFFMCAHSMGLMIPRTCSKTTWDFLLICGDLKMIKALVSTMAKLFSIHLNTHFRTTPFEPYSSLAFHFITYITLSHVLSLNTNVPLFRSVNETMIVTSCFLLCLRNLWVPKKTSVGVASKKSSSKRKSKKKKRLFVK
jgi:hypothetical protein